MKKLNILLGLFLILYDVLYNIIKASTLFLGKTSLSGSKKIYDTEKKYRVLSIFISIGLISLFALSINHIFYIIILGALIIIGFLVTLVYLLSGLIERVYLVRFISFLLSIYMVHLAETSYNEDAVFKTTNTFYKEMIIYDNHDNIVCEDSNTIDVSDIKKYTHYDGNNRYIKVRLLKSSKENLTNTWIKYQDITIVDMSDYKKQTKDIHYEN